jgi:hypothetical protein
MLRVGIRRWIASDRGGSYRSFVVVATICLCIFALLWGISYWVLYTGGEIDQISFRFLTAIPLVLLVAGLFRPKLTVLFLLILGGGVLGWQLPNIQKLVTLQEEAQSIVHFVLAHKRKTGSYPLTLDHYSFKNGWVTQHVDLSSDNDTGKFQLNYFMQDRSVSYWFSSDTGFGYYPD